jgi:hypothetical protein
VEQDEKPYKIKWYYTAGLFVVMIAYATIVLTAGWFLGALAEYEGKWPICDHCEQCTDCGHYDGCEIGADKAGGTDNAG